MGLEGKVAIVTGSAMGIGKAVALRLAKEGADVVVADIDLEQANNVVTEIEAMGRKAIAVETDVRQSQQVNQMFETTMGKFGRVDILVNNAGGSAHVIEKQSLFHESTEEVWDYVIDINLKGTLNCTRAVINHMMQRQSGKIINISSGAGMIGHAGAADYSAAKAGIIGFTMALAKELGAYGINVNSVSPGPIETRGMLAHPEFAEKFRKEVYLGRLGKPEDISNIIAFLVSDEASFLTGQNYSVCGGRHLGFSG